MTDIDTDTEDIFMPHISDKDIDDYIQMQEDLDNLKTQLETTSTSKKKSFLTIVFFKYTFYSPQKPKNPPPPPTAVFWIFQMSKSVVLDFFSKKKNFED